MNNSRHLTIFDSEPFKYKAIHIVGCGNIGSHTAEAIARMGFENIFLYDFDDVEEVNLSTQNFLTSDIGKPKIEVIDDRLLQINRNIVVTKVPGAITADSKLPIEPGNTLALISGLDSIEARSMLCQLLIDSKIQVEIIDGRIGKEQVEVLHADFPEAWDIEIGDEERADVSCTEKYISYTPILCAALIANNLKKICLNEEIEYHQLFNFKTLNYIKL